MVLAGSGLQKMENKKPCFRVEAGSSERGGVEQVAATLIYLNKIPAGAAGFVETGESRGDSRCAHRYVAWPRNR